MSHRIIPRRMHGFTMFEVLVTLMVLAFGLLGLAAMQGKMQLTGVESYQRSQAHMILQDMVNRIQVNSANAPAYVTGANNPLGVGDAQPADCSALAIGVARDQCEWSNALKGAAETAGGNSVGAMMGGRGCVEQITAPNAAPGICTPGTYRVSVAWQGLHSTGVPNLACANNADYGEENMRRVIASVITVPLLNCE